MSSRPNHIPFGKESEFNVSQITIARRNCELTSAELDGDPDFLILDAGTIRECRPNWLTLVSDEKHFKEFCLRSDRGGVYTDAPPLNDSKITETPTGVK